MNFLRKLNIFKKFSQKKILIFGLVFIIALGSIYTFFIINKTKEENRFILLQSARIASTTLNENIISNLYGDLRDTANSTYLELKEFFTKINNNGEDIRYVYLIGKRGDSLFFYLDSQPTEYSNDSLAKPLAVPGEIYNDASEEFYLAFKNKSEYIFGPYKDKWGSFVSAVIPILNKENEVIAVLGMDINVKRWNTIIFLNSIPPILITVLMCLLLFVAVRYANNRLHAEMTIRRINEGLEQKIQERTKELLVINEELKNQIIERENVEKALQQSEKRYRDFINFLPQIVFETDASGKLLFVNQCAYEVMGYTYDDLIKGVNIFQMIVKEDREKAMVNIQKIVRQEYNLGNEYMMQKKDGTVFPAIVYSAPIFENKKYIGLRGIAIDISYQRQVEELKRKTEIAENTAKFKQMFLANMSHEMRTPMNGIINMIQFLLQTPLSEKQHYYAQIIKESSENLLAIINNILDLSKIEAGKMQLKPVVFNIHNVNRKVKDLFDVLKKDKKVSLIIEYDNKVPDYLFADENKIHQILLNLVSNALKFTNEGFVKIKYSLIEQHENKVKVMVEVIDTGIGIAVEAQEKIFMTFTQLDSSGIYNKYEGTGLGLSISKELSKLLGGEIGVKSKLGDGSTFWFSFIADMVSSEDIAKMKTENYTLDTFSNLNVLVAEDKDVNIKIITLLLENVGCIVTVAQNGLEAINKIENEIFDLIFMDIQMPVMDGVTAIKILREKYKTNLPPVIALTANAMEGDHEYYLQIGMDDYLSKPIDAKTLYEKINFWCREK